MRNTTVNITTKKNNNKYDLGPSMKKAFLTRGVAELLDVLRFHCLNLGCQHVRAENCLSTGSLKLKHVCEDSVACGNKCAIFNGSWTNTFLPVYKVKVEKFIRVMGCKYLPLKADEDNIIDVLWKEEKPRIEGIYGKKTITKYNVGGLFFAIDCKWYHHYQKHKM